MISEWPGRERGIPTFSMTPVSPQSYGTRLPVGMTTRRRSANLSSCSFECIAPGPCIGGKQNLMLEGMLPRIRFFYTRLPVSNLTAAEGLMPGERRAEIGEGEGTSGAGKEGYLSFVLGEC